MKYIIVLVLFLTLVQSAAAYPLDGYGYTDIKRLEYYRLAQEGVVRGMQLPSGALLMMDQVEPRLSGISSGQAESLPAIDVELSNKIRRLLGREASRYSVTLLDLSTPSRPRYAELNADQRTNIGSVGKLLVALAVFQQLADLYPDDIAKRERVLRESQIIADDFVIYDEHKVPLWDNESKRVTFRRLRPGDRGSLWEYLDWMLSASSNAAASMVMKHLMLLSVYGKNYPLTNVQSDVFFKNTSRIDLGDVLLDATRTPLVRNGLDPEALRQGSFFTREGKRRVPGASSYGNSRELMKLLYKLENGTLVDTFSSREIKRLLYMTQKRIRYASHPALFNAAVYFKSGSLYSCQPEPGYVCGKYKGNRVNRLASVAIIESPAGKPKYHYMVVVMSNVLKKNSAVAHQTLAKRIHRLIEAEHGQVNVDGVGR